jgi:O-antigen/teichoic acid export membrane protein
MIASEPFARPALGAVRLPRGWEAWVLFAGLPIWWLLGLQPFIWPLLTLPMLLALLVRRTVRVPRGFGIWIVLLTWMLLSGSQLETGNQMLAFAQRMSVYIAATVLFLYVFNASEQRLPTRSILRALTAYWVVFAVGGWLGVLYPNGSYSTLAETVLPASLTSNSYVHELVHIKFAQPMDMLGYTVGRTSIFFDYTNRWGSMYALLFPVVLLTLRGIRSPFWRHALIAAMALSAVPFVFSLDRTAWGSLAVGLVYAAVRFGVRGHARGLAGLAALFALVGALIVTTPLGDMVNGRFTSEQNSNAGRAALYRETIDRGMQQPVLGYGGPRDSLISPLYPATGTQSEYFLLFFSHGIPGLVLYVWFFVLALRRAHRRRSELAFWLTISLIMFLLQAPFYEMATPQIQIMMALIALLYREELLDRTMGRIRGRDLALPPLREPELEPLAAAVALPAAEVPTSLAERTPGARRRLKTRRRTRRGRPRVVHRPPRDAARAEGRSDLAKLARGGSLNLVGGIVSGAVAFVLTMIVAHALGATAAGVFLEVTALFTILSSVAELGASAGIVRYLARSLALGRPQDVRPQVSLAIWPVLAAGTLLGLILFVLAPQLSVILINDGNRDDAVMAMRVLAILLPLDAGATVLQRAAQGLGSMVPFVSLTNIGLPLSRVLLAAVVAVAGMGTAAMALAWGVPIVAGVLVTVPWLLLLVRRAEGTQVADSTLRSPRQLADEFWRFTSYQAVAGIMQVVLLWVDVLLVGALRTAEEAAVYSGASRYVSTGKIMLTAITFVIGPQLAGLMAQGSWHRARRVYQTSTLWLTALAFPAYLLLATWAPLLMSLFGPGFEEGAWALAILSLANLVNMSTGAVKSMLLMGGKSSWVLWDTALALAIDVVLNLILIPPYGMNGAAIAWAASIVAVNLIPLVQVWKSFRMQPFTRGWPAVAGAALLCFGGGGLLSRLLLPDTLPSFFAYAAIATIAYGAFLWRLRRVLHAGVLREALSVRSARRARQTEPLEIS